MGQANALTDLAGGPGTKVNGRAFAPHAVTADDGNDGGNPLQHNIRLWQVALMRFHALQNMGNTHTTAFGFDQVENSNQQQTAAQQQGDACGFAEVFKVVRVGNRQQGRERKFNRQAEQGDHQRTGQTCQQGEQRQTDLVI